LLLLFNKIEIKTAQLIMTKNEMLVITALIGQSRFACN